MPYLLARTSNETRVSSLSDGIDVLSNYVSLVLSYSSPVSLLTSSSSGGKLSIISSVSITSSFLVIIPKFRGSWGYYLEISLLV